MRKRSDAMKTLRLILLASTAVLVAASLSGCLRQSQPQALFTATQTEDVIPFTVGFNGSLSYAPDGDIVSYLWTFGDGSSETGPVTEHTFQEDGMYDVRLLVIDSKGASTSSSVTIHALNPPPTAGFEYSPKSNMDGTYIVSCSETVTFDARNLCSDDGDIVAYEWYFGYREADGSPATDSGPVVEHEFLYPGTYTIILTVTDDDGGTGTYEEKLDVIGGKPCNADVDSGTCWGGTCQ
jgi:PKD repeat protein